MRTIHRPIGHAGYSTAMLTISFDLLLLAWPNLLPVLCRRSSIQMRLQRMAMMMVVSLSSPFDRHAGGDTGAKRAKTHCKMPYSTRHEAVDLARRPAWFRRGLGGRCSPSAERGYSRGPPLIGGLVLGIGAWFCHV